MGETGFWDDNESAQKTIAEMKTLRSVVGPLTSVRLLADRTRILTPDILPVGLHATSRNV